MTEIWKPVIGYDGYEVSSFGRVRSLDREWQQRGRRGTEGLHLHRKKGQMLRPGNASHGYPTVVLGRRNTRTVHSLVAEAFLGPRPEGQEVRHKDGDRANPRLTNLCYGTRLDNINDARAHGTWMSAKRKSWVESGNARRKFSNSVIASVRASTGTIAEIAAAHGMSKTHAWSVRRGKHKDMLRG